MIGRDLGLDLARRKPLGIPRIDTRHPLARGLTFATLLTGDGRPRDLVLGRTASGAGTAYRNTPQGQALLFNGSSDAANFGDISTYRPGAQLFTVMAYANPAAGGATLGLASKRNSSTFTQLSFAANMDQGGGPSSGQLGMFLYDGSNQLSAATTSSPVNGQFHQFVGQRTSSSLMAFYVDGVLQGITHASNANANYVGSEPLFIGAMGGTAAPSGGYLPGSIGYVYIWRGRVLTTAEIQWLYQNPYAFVREAPRQEPWLTIWVPSAGGGGTSVTPNAIATAEVVSAPTVSLQVLPGTIATGVTVYAPTVSVGALAGQVSPGTITSGEVVFPPTVRVQVLAGAIATAQQVYAPFVALLTPQTVTPNAIGTAELVRAPAFVGFTIPAVQPDGIPSAALVYAPGITVVPRSRAPSFVREPGRPAPVLVAAGVASAPAFVTVVTSRAPSLAPVP